MFQIVVITIYCGKSLFRRHRGAKQKHRARNSQCEMRKKLIMKIKKK